MSPTLKASDGTMFTQKTLEVWDGSAYVVKPLKVWDGTQWALVGGEPPVVGTEHSINPNTAVLSSYTDGNPRIRLGSWFYTTGVNELSCVGGRVYIPAGSPAIGNKVRMYAYLRTIGIPSSGGDLGFDDYIRTADVDVTTSGWIDVHWDQRVDLLGEWMFNDNLDDSSGNAHNGTADFAPTFEAGPLPGTRAVRFPDDHHGTITLGSEGLSPTTRGVTSMSWFKIPALPPDYSTAMPVKPRTGDGSTRFGADFDSNGLFWLARWKDDLHYSTYTSTPVGVWAHVATVDAENEWTVYLNGSVIASGTRSGDGTPFDYSSESIYPWVIGKAPGLCNSVFGASTSMARIFQGAMSQEQVRAWMNNKDSISLLPGNFIFIAYEFLTPGNGYTGYYHAGNLGGSDAIESTTLSDLYLAESSIRSGYAQGASDDMSGAGSSLWFGTDIIINDNVALTGDDVRLFGNLMANSFSNVRENQITYNLGTEFYVTKQAWVTEIHFMMPTSGNGSLDDRRISIWQVDSANSGTQVVPQIVVTPYAFGVWNTFKLPTPFELTPSQHYRAVLRLDADDGYVAIPAFFGAGNTDYTNEYLVAPNAGNSFGNDQGSYTLEGDIFPDQSFNYSFYGIDVTVVDTLG